MAAQRVRGGQGDLPKSCIGLHQEACALVNLRTPLEGKVAIPGKIQGLPKKPASEAGLLNCITPLGELPLRTTPPQPAHSCAAAAGPSEADSGLAEGSCSRQSRGRGQGSAAGQGSSRGARSGWRAGPTGSHCWTGSSTNTHTCSRQQSGREPSGLAGMKTLMAPSVLQRLTY